MPVDKNSVAYMKGYLKYALEFEKYVYIWSKAMNEANARMTEIYSQRRQLESAKANSANRLNSLGGINERQIKQKASEAARCRKKANKTAIIMVVLLLLLFGLGAALGVGLISDPETKITIPRGAVIPVLGISVMAVFSIFTGIVPICIGIITKNKKKAKDLESDARALASGSSLRRQETILRSRIDDTEKEWASITIEESAIGLRQEEIHHALLEAKSSLQQIYSLNVLPQKYRTLTAVATMYEYLETGRCNTVQGHGGIYDTFEVEKIHLAQLQQMVMMNERLSNIEDYQRYICQEMRQANETLSDISASLNEIEKTNAQIAKNTAISAEANRQTAAATQWLAWNAWANGY